MAKKREFKRARINFRITESLHKDVKRYKLNAAKICTAALESWINYYKNPLIRDILCNGSPEDIAKLRARGGEGEHRPRLKIAHTKVFKGRKKTSRQTKARETDGQVPKKPE